MVGCLAGVALRILGRSGTALPGKLALRIAPRLLGWLTAGRTVFLVTGTNGKTTTVRLLGTILRAQGWTVVTNPSGANLDSGLTSVLLRQLRDLRRSEAQQPTALVFEIDEAFFGKLAADLNPTVCVVTNFFRDQLDRFGELRHTRDLIAHGLAAGNPRAVLCADDSLCASLGRDVCQAPFYFAMEPGQMRQVTDQDIPESPFCLFCGGRYQYSGVAYGHLGDFRCPDCGFARPKPDLLFRVTDQQPQAQTLVFTRANGEEATVRLPVPGVHNAYNAAAALMAALAAGLPLAESAAALQDAGAAFGRMERFAVGRREVCLILIKNPVGMDRALDYLQSVNDQGGVMFLLNSHESDGRDISWIWDADLEHHLPDGAVGVTGERGNDLALRLQYAGKPIDQILLSDQPLALFDQLLEACPEERCLYVLPNYTAMLALRAELARRYGLRPFWQ